MTKNSSNEKSDFRPYDPSWLVALAEEQYPKDGWLATALAESTQYRKADDAYFYLSGSKPVFGLPPLPGFGNVILRSPERGELVLDVAKDRTIRGIEFISEITGDEHFLENCEQKKIIVD